MPDHITKAQIDTRLAYYRERIGPFHTECENVEDFINVNVKWRDKILAAYLAGFPVGFRPKSLPLAKMVVRSFKNSVMAGEIPDVKGVLDLPEDEEPSDVMERKRQITEQFYKAFLYESAMRTASNPYSELLDNSGGLGLGILSFPFDESKWPDEDDPEYESKLKECFPWHVSVLHPRNIYPDSDHDPPQDYITEDEISVIVAREQYPDLEYELTETGKVKRLIYCSENDYAVYIGGQPAFGNENDGVVDNPMGMLWYELALSGNGRRDASNDPVYLWQGFVHDLRDMIAIIVTNYNLQEAAKWKEVYGPQQVEAQTVEQAQAAIKAVELKPMSFVPTETGVNFKPIFPFTQQGTLLREQEAIERLFEMMGGPLSGNFRSTESTSSGLAQRVGLQELPYQAGKVSAEQAIANMLKKVVKYYKYSLGKKFYMRGGQRKFQEFNPDDLLDNLIIEVNLKPVTDADRAMSVDKDLKELDAGRISGAEYDRRQNIRDTAKLQDERAQEAIRFHPLMIETAVTVATRALMPQPEPTTNGQPAQGPQQSVQSGAAAAEPYNPNPNQQNGSMMAALAGVNAPVGPRG